MKFSLVCLLVCAMTVVVYSTKCPHEDKTACTGVTCTNMGEEVGCEHGTCTCVQSVVTTAATSCMDLSDCPQDTHCGHGKSVHCVDKTCQCINKH